MKPTVLVTGANRGIGLELCRQYLAAGWQVTATCRRPEAAAELTALAATRPDLEILALDVADFEQIDALAARWRERPLDVLINNAAIFGDAAPHGFGQLDYARWAEVLRVNTLAPMKLAEALLPALLAGQRKLIVAVSTLMASLADNGSGGYFLYRSSKAGLNAAMKSLALDLREQGVGVLLLHPGWVRTDMGGPQAPTLPAESVTGMRRVIEGFRLEDTGRFVNFRGESLPW